MGIKALIKMPEALRLYGLPLSELAATADRARRESTDGKMQICSIINAKSGRCGENCKFCAQSAGHGADVEEYPLKTREELIDGARRARDMGSDHFGIVTSGRGLSGKDIEIIAGVVSEIVNEIKIDVCASLGCLPRNQLELLKQSGLSRYNHNIETSRRFFPHVVSSHSFEDRISTVKAAKEAGLSVCCGGIIGMGETREDRVSMALTLKELDVDSVPINILIPIPGTPMGDLKPMDVSEALKTVAIFRIIMPDKTIKLAAGREKILRDFQGMAFMAGANGMLVGGYLTQKGRSVEDDMDLVGEIETAWNL